MAIWGPYVIFTTDGKASALGLVLVLAMVIGVGDGKGSVECVIWLRMLLLLGFFLLLYSLFLLLPTPLMPIYSFPF